MKEKILISTGGSGGHVIPAITIYDHLKNEYEVVISTDLRGLKYLDVNNYKIFEVNTPKFKRSILLPLIILKVFFLTIKSLFLLKNEKIQILISTGGYMTLPLCLAAKILSIKIFLLEPNMIIGRVNKLFLNFCKKIICYDKNIIGIPNKFKNKLVISNPIIRKKYYEKNFKEKIDRIFTLIIIGGSQGAKIFDEIIHESILKISKNNTLKIIHQTNKKNIDFFKNFYLQNKIENIVFDFDQNLDVLLNQSDLCITRAGASSLAEVALLNIPFIAIPLPTSKEGLLLDLLKNKDIIFKKKIN